MIRPNDSISRADEPRIPTLVEGLKKSDYINVVGTKVSYSL